MATAHANHSHRYQSNLLKVCNRFYLQGDCPRADRCFFRHVKEDQVIVQDEPTLLRPFTFAQLKNPPSSSGSSSSAGSSTELAANLRTPICRFFLRGNCRFGDKCHFWHAPDLSSPPSKNSGGTSASASASSSSTNTLANAFSSLNLGDIEDDKKTMSLCVIAQLKGACPDERNCRYLHGDNCDVCNMPTLHPFNIEQREEHIRDCITKHELEARSKEKSCGICFEVVLEKEVKLQTFGILPNCTHCYCITCIRKWRKSRQFDDEISKACPECRVLSNFVCPSRTWVEEAEEKNKVICDYKNRLNKMHCKYFKRGEGRCPFGNECFYLHALPDGTVKDVGPPGRRRRKRYNPENDLFQMLLVLEEADHNDFIDNWYDEYVGDWTGSSDESDFDDYDILFF